IDLPQVDPNLGLEEKVSFLEGLVSAMQGIITTLSVALENYQTQLDAEAAAREAADAELQNQLKSLSKPQIVSYQREILITVPPGEQSYHSITCPDGNLAQSGGIDILTEQIPKFKTFANHMEGSTGWTVESVNNHESDSVDMTLYVNCLKIEMSPDLPEIAPAITLDETASE
ncbi:MAG TPA: hypothetical protein VD731_08105, partial [Nitrosopumilaceae archaeon]|nr:hypothetical protein [Nitrosopumilaceae archaeon]